MRKNPRIIATHRDDKFESEINERMQPRQARRFDYTPDVKQLKENEYVHIVEGGKYYIATRIDGVIRKTELL